VLGETLKDLEGFAKTLPREDREKVQFHADAVSKLDADLAAAGTVSGCNVPARPGAPGNLAAEMKTRLDLVAETIACDIARVITVQWSQGFGTTFADYSFIGAPGNHHLNSHGLEGGPNGTANFIKAGNWFAGQMAYLMTRLASINEEGGKTALDNTAVVWVSELASGYLHDNQNCPYVIGGGLGGAVRGGRVLNVNGKTNNDMWVSLMKGMGLGDTSFGSPEYNSGGFSLS
jgi:hypothetical protein